MNNINIAYRESSPTDRATIEQVLVQQCYDVGVWRNHAPALRRYLSLITAAKRTPLIVDAGAHIGCASLFFAEAWPEAYIVAVEPQHDNYCLLAKNAEKCPRIIALQKAVAAASGDAYVHDPGRGEWAYRVSREPSLFPVYAWSVPDLLDIADNNDERIRFAPFIFKCDIEGSEADLFESNTAWVDDFPLIIIEVHDWLFPGEHRSRNFLSTLGALDFDVMPRGEDLFCFNNRLLRDYYE